MKEKAELAPERFKSCVYPRVTCSCKGFGDFWVPARNVGSFLELLYVSGEREGKGGSGGEEFIWEISWETRIKKI